MSKKDLAAVQALPNPLEVLIQILDNIPYAIVVIENRDTPRIIFKNKTCKFSDDELLSKYSTLDRNETKIRNIDGVTIYQYATEITGSDITFDVVHFSDKLYKTSNREGSKNKSLTESINKVKSANSRLETLIKDRMSSMSQDVRDTIANRKSLIST